jgi:hypothetical protein
MDKKSYGKCFRPDGKDLDCCGLCYSWNKISNWGSFRFNGIEYSGCYDYLEIILKKLIDNKEK